MWKKSPRGFLLSGLVVFLALSVFNGSLAWAMSRQRIGRPKDLAFLMNTVYLPLIARAYPLPQPLCRLGLNLVSRRIDDYPLVDLAQLRAYWYFNWGTALNPPKPNGMEFAQSVFVKQWKQRDENLVLYDATAPYAEPYTYTIRPSISQIQQIARANPGSLWLIGNEIERRDWPTSGGGAAGQNEILPEVYAWVYHEVYKAIKEADPSARVANGSIIVPTPLRLQYMTRVWDEYLRRYGEPMPVDVWQIHVYLGPEKRNDWGIDIPAGIDADVGMFYFDGDPTKRILVNKDFSYVPGLIRDFRVWMKERGQQNKPLIISEFGVSMPDWIMPGEFTPEKIRDEYMYPGLTYLLNARDPDLGYPADDYRLVQSVWWWSLDGDGGEYEGSDFYQYFNGNLFWSGIGWPTHSPNPMGITPLGQYWIQFVSQISTTFDLQPLNVEAWPAAFSPDGSPVTVTLKIYVSNSGNSRLNGPVQVTLQDESTGSLIADVRIEQVDGCGGIAQAQAIWSNLTPGVHRIRIKVDPSDQIYEIKEDNNEAVFSIIVASSQSYLPLILRR